MRNMTGAAKARLLSELYREKGAEIESRTHRTAREWLEQDADRDAGGGAAQTLDHARDDAA